MGHTAITSRQNGKTIGHRDVVMKLEFNVSGSKQTGFFYLWKQTYNAIITIKESQMHEYFDPSRCRYDPDVPHP